MIAKPRASVASGLTVFNVRCARSRRCSARAIAVEQCVRRRPARSSWRTRRSRTRRSGEWRTEAGEELAGKAALVVQLRAQRVCRGAAQDHRGVAAAGQAARPDARATAAAARRRCGSRAPRSSRRMAATGGDAPSGRALQPGLPVGHDALGRAEGVGARASAAKSAIVKSISWPMPGDHRHRAGTDGARNALVVECPQILERSPAARQNQHIALAAARGELERRDDARRRRRALHRRRIDEHRGGREAAREHVQDVAQGSARG